MSVQSKFIENKEFEVVELKKKLIDLKMSFNSLPKRIKQCNKRIIKLEKQINFLKGVN